MKLFTLLLALWTANAAAEKSFLRTNPRNNAVCYVAGKRLEIFIRGASETTEPAEKGMGESLFYKVGESAATALKSQGFDTYKFFGAPKSGCTKTAGYLLSKDRFVVMFLRESNPFYETVAFQSFEVPSLKPLELVETEYRSTRAYKKDDAIYFMTVLDNQNSKLGKVKIGELEYTYQDRDFPVWMSYRSSGFELLPDITFRNLPWRRFFKNEKEFLEVSGWDPANKKFKNSVAYLANNPVGGKKCVLFTPTKIDITGAEKWRCQ